MKGRDFKQQSLNVVVKLTCPCCGQAVTAFPDSATMPAPSIRPMEVAVQVALRRSGDKPKATRSAVFKGLQEVFPDAALVTITAAIERAIDLRLVQQEGDDLLIP